MRFLFVCVLLAAVGAVLAFCGSACAAEPGVAKFTVGKATVWAIADSISERDMNVFPDAGPEEISKYAPSGKTPSATMTFLVKIGDELILIDAGMGAPSGDRASRLIDGLKQAGVAPEQITLVLITHMHGDHIGGLAKLGKSDEKAFPSARVLSAKPENDFWLDPKSVELFPNRAAGFEMARNILGLYGAASETFEFGAEVAPGLRALDASGHTPGHALFLLESDGEKMLFWADLVHAAALQFPRPDINAQYDMNLAEAAAARVRFMEKAADEKLPIAGVHLPYPGVGTVTKNASGGYIYTSR